jgi:Ser/Thr protein kinase RdoA (MazF antagonist)
VRTNGLLAALAEAYALEAPTLIAKLNDRVLRVATAAGRELAVKVFEDAQHAELEAALLHHLAPPDPRYRVQTLVPTARGESVWRASLGQEPGEVAVLVTDWEPGVYRPYDAIPERDWHALGVSLAALHARLDSFEVPLPRLSERIAARDLAEEITRLSELSLRVRAKDPARDDLVRYLDAQRAVLEARGPRARRCPADPERPIHNDYNQFNYLFVDEGPPLILDWEGAIGAPREYEVVRCMNHLPILAPRCAAAFLDGYCGVRELAAAGLRWAVDAALAEHAMKRWPIERWFAGEPDAERHVAGSAEILATLQRHAPELEELFAARGTR